MDVDIRYESPYNGEQDVKQEQVSPVKMAAVDCLDEVEKLLSAYNTPDSNSLTIVKRTKTTGEQFLQVTNISTDGETYFSHLCLVVEATTDDTVFRLLATRHYRLVKEVVVNNTGGRLNLLGQLKATIAFFLMEMVAEKYEACQGAFDEESFVGDFSSLDIRGLLVEVATSGAGVVYRARTCPTLLLREAGEVCDACLQLRESQSHNLEQDDEEDEGSMGMLSQYLEVSMDDEMGEPVSGPDKATSEQYQDVDVKPRTNLQILRHGLESNSNHTLNLKPKLSYKKLIAMAIKDSHYKMLKLTDIYSWILARYPGFNSNRTGFQNSVRHNLSLNKVFIKVNMPGVANNGKGNYWTINPKFEDAANSFGDVKPMKNLRTTNIVSQYVPIRPKPLDDGESPNAGDSSELEDHDNGSGDADTKTILPDNSNIHVTLQPRHQPYELNEGGEHDFSDGLVLEKPNFSYKELIMIAIFCEPSQQVCLNDIYLTIKHWFPYYQQRNVGLTWQNSVRHNLSLNKCFRRLAPTYIKGGGRIELPRGSTTSKGGNWTFSEADETWQRLIRTRKKWAELRTCNNGSSEGLLIYLARKSAEFRNFVFSKIFTSQEMERLGIEHTDDKQLPNVELVKREDSEQEHDDVNNSGDDCHSEGQLIISDVAGGDKNDCSDVSELADHLVQMEQSLPA